MEQSTLSPMYSLSPSTMPHLYIYITPLFCQMVSLSLGFTRRSLIVLPPLNCICIPFVCCRCFYSSHLVPWCKAPLYEVCWCWWLCCSWCCWNLFWTCWVWCWPYLRPKQGTCIFNICLGWTHGCSLQLFKEPAMKLEACGLRAE